MTPEIERLAKEAGMVPINQRIMRRDGDYIRYEATPAPLPEWVAKFAALVAEECAKEADHWGAIGKGPHPEHVCGQYIGATIRAKFALSELKDAAK